MKGINSRLRRLERQAGATDPFPGLVALLDDCECTRWLERRGYPDLLAAVQAGEADPFLKALALFSWWGEKGYADCLAAVEAGETVPNGLEDVAQEYAEADRKRRAFCRIEAALDAGQLPNDADVRLCCGH
jgi:hypothetical protein